MKPLKTYDYTGTHDGYFDHVKGFEYRAYRRVKQTGEDDRAVFLVRVYYPCVDSDGDQVGAFLSPEFDTREEAMAELDDIAERISGKAAPVGQKWTEGPPPKNGAFYLVAYGSTDVGVAKWRHDIDEYVDDGDDDYARNCIRYHVPTPIEAP